MASANDKKGQIAVGKALRLLRLRKDISLFELGTRTRHRQSALSLMELGKRDFRLSSLRDFARQLRLSLVEIFSTAELFEGGAPDLETELKTRFDAMRRKGRPPKKAKPKKKTRKKAAPKATA